MSQTKTSQSEMFRIERCQNVIHIQNSGFCPPVYDVLGILDVHCTSLVFLVNESSNFKSETNSESGIE